MLVALPILTISIVYSTNDSLEDSQWMVLASIQVLTSVWFPFIELMVSPKVRFWFKDLIDSFNGDLVPADVVIVT
jgi:hypothetical protein